MYAINGLMYCNLPRPTLALNSRVRVVFLGVGSEEGLHAPRILGERRDAATFPPSRSPARLLSLAPRRAATRRLTAAAACSLVPALPPAPAGQSLTAKSGAVSAAQILPSLVESADLTAVSAGKWPISCDVHTHMSKGMLALIEVAAPASAGRKAMRL